MKRIGVAVLIALSATLAACSGVPSSSAPETVEALDTAGASAQVTKPPHLVDGDARQIVESFLGQNATTNSSHAIARAYLTSAANNRWSDDTATIVANEPTIGTFDTDKQTVTVLGRVLGTLTANGIYTPSLQGDGQGGERQPFVFHVVQLDNNQWRIDRLPPGLLLSEDQFRDTYRQQVLYFYSLSEESLVPDLRWSALVDRVPWSEWLLTQLVEGPRQSIASAVSPDTMPAHVDPGRITVQLGGTATLIEVPGSSQLDAGVRDRLAAQVSLTLVDALSGREMSITDGQVPVQIPRVAGTVFDASDFAASIGPATPASEVYYLSGGRVRDDSGVPLDGPLGDGTYFLGSVAIGRPLPGGTDYAAGITGTGDSTQLQVGTVRDGLRPTQIRGALSRPAFAPGRPEVWIGGGSKLYRVTLDGSKPREYPVQILSGGGQIVALRFSPEGSRIAIVITGASGATQLYIGTVVRGAGPVRVDGLQPVSPVGVVVTDVAWLDAFKLFAIGYLASSQDSRTFETGVDGTDWTNSTLGNLPDPPDSITAATSANVWVSTVTGYVWELNGTSWVSPGTTGQTVGTQPVYLE
ncbi:MAG: hypothetical protein QOH89_2011 [Pseudonocardiales bacterium]|nr:hypothetical protein [Pseudonocardiales bacterium]